MRIALILTLGLLTGCPQFESTEPYYSGGPKPEVSALEPASELGTIGGGTVTISGANFGEDANKLLVLFAQTNAPILSVTDTSITVQVPPGPMTGGPVDVRIATPTGYQVVEDGYTYTVSSMYATQKAHVLVQNFGQTNAASFGFGYASSASGASFGIDGKAEAYSFFSSRYQTADTAVWGTADQAPGDWRVENPAISKFAFGVEDLHEDIGSIYLVNEAQEAEPTYYCVDYDVTAVFPSARGNVSIQDYPNVTTSTDGSCPERNMLYASDQLEFCTSQDADGVSTKVYNADWGVVSSARSSDYVDFFSYGRTKYEDFRLDIPELKDTDPATPLQDDPGIHTQFKLPEPVVFSVDGFDNPDAWSTGEVPTCFTGRSAMVFNWQPSLVALTSPTADVTTAQNGDIVGVNSYIQISIDLAPYGWFGLNTPMRRIVTTVPDSIDGTLDPQTLSLPIEVMQQMPYAAPFPTGMGSGALNLETNEVYGVMYLTAVRVTDYAIHSDQLHGEVVFSYVTGDIGFYTNWTQPAGGCP